MKAARIGAALAAVALLASASTVRAELRPEQRRCQKAVARAGQRYVNRAAAALSACHDDISRGRLPAMTDCPAEPETSDTLATLAVRLRERILRKCSDAAVASLIFGDACAGMSSALTLSACIRATHEAEVDALIGTLYGAAGQLSAAGQSCQARASRETRAFVIDRLVALQRCKNRAGRGRLSPGVHCVAEARTAALIASQRASAAAGIADRCDVASLPQAGFGSPCASESSVSALTDCLLAAGDGAADAASLVEYADGGFCGDAHQAVNARVETLLQQMTLAEKVEQMHGTGFVDGVWRTADNTGLGIPGFGMTDGPRGVSKGAGNATAFPVGMARGATWDLDLERRVGAAIGTEARAVGASVLLAPVTTVVRHPRWGRSQETYGEDPLLVGRMGVGFIHGAQQHVIASAKHYALNSIEDTRFDVNVTVDERTLREIYLPHFRMAVQEGQTGSVMSAYNKVNGLYCAENPPLLSDILKDEWGFEGFVESDWLLGTRSTVASALAGLDIEMPLPVFYGPPLVTAVGDGDVPEATVDEAVRRIVRTKLCFRLDTDPPVENPALIESQEHTDLALEAAQKAIVLLKNAGATLPLDLMALGSIAVVGPLADLENLGDTGSSDVEPSYAVTALEGIDDRAGAVPVTHVPGPTLSPAEEATIAAADAAVVVVGLTSDDEGEGLVGAGDRVMMDLSADQEQLIADVAALNATTIVVLEGGSAITVESWIDDVEALLMAWYPGMEGGNAIADVIFGNVNPSGKLPLTFPHLEADLPPFDNVSLEVTYDYYHGYRLLDRDAVDPRFPFGFGLSYTTYGYANLVVEDATLDADDTLRVSVDVTNTGAVAGDEIVQLYVSYVGSSVDRPVRDLKAFARVPLAPSETKTVELSVAVADLAFYNVSASAWEVEPISYVAHVGRSSRDLPLSAGFAVSGGP
jgi:beta-glucosidase